MRLKTRLAVALSMVLTLSPILNAVDAKPEPLPERIGGLVSVKSVSGLIDNIDGFASAVTAGTAGAVPPGIIPMMAQMYAPIPGDAWKIDGDAQLAFLKGHMASNSVTFIIGVDGFDEFIKALEENGADITEVEEKPAKHLGKMTAFNMNGLRATVLDLGEGRVAIGRNEDTLSLVFGMTEKDAWLPPVHSGKSALLASFSLEPLWDEISFDELIDEISDDKEEIKAKAAKAGLNPDVVDAVMTALEKYIPSIEEELVKSKSVIVDLNLDGDEISLTLRGDFADDALLAEMGTSLSKQENVWNDLADKVAVGPMSLAVNAAPAALLPDIGARTVKFAEELGETAYPTQKDRVAKLLADSHANTASTVTAAYMDGSRVHNATWMRSKDPAAFIKTVGEAFDLLNDLVAHSITEPKSRFRFESSSGTAGAAGDYVLYKPVFADPAALDAFTGDLASVDASLARSIAQFKKTAVYVGHKDGVITVVAGEALEEDFIAAMETLAGTDDPMTGQDEVKNALQSLKHRQGSVAVIEADKFFLVMAREIAASLDATNPESGSLHSTLLDETIPDFETSDDMLAFGFGAYEGQPLFELIASTDAINTIVVNVSLLNKVFEEGTGDEEDWDEDDEEEEVIIEEDDEEA